MLSFYRKPRVDYALVFRERLKQVGLDACKEEFQLRAIEHTVNLCRANTGLDLEGAKKLVLGVINQEKHIHQGRSSRDEARQLGLGR